VDGDLALIVRGPAGQQQAVLLHRLEGRRCPKIQRVDRLHVVVSVHEHGRLIRGVQPVGVDHRVAGGVDHLRILQPNVGVDVGQVIRRRAHVVGVLRLAGNAGNTQEAD